MWRQRFGRVSNQLGWCDCHSKFCCWLNFKTTPAPTHPAFPFKPGVKSLALLRWRSVDWPSVARVWHTNFGYLQIECCSKELGQLVAFILSSCNQTDNFVFPLGAFHFALGEDSNWIPNLICTLKFRLMSKNETIVLLCVSFSDCVIW